MGPSALSSWVLLIARTLRRYGLDADAAFQAAQLAPRQLGEPTSRYPLADVRRLWAVASQMSGDPCFGLEVGRSWHVTTFHALGYAALASASLREALERVARYCRVVTTGARLELAEKGRHTELQLTSAAGGEREAEFAEAPAQAGLAALATLCREARGAPADPEHALLMQKENASRSRLEAFFRCPIRFDAPRNALVFTAADLDSPLETANSALMHLNEKAVTRYLSALEDARVGERVRAEVLAALPGGTISQAAVAHRVHMSLRTLQRRLQSEGLTFRAVVDSARGQLARKYAKDRSIAKEEIAYLLGFSEPRSLSRAMTRWKERRDPFP
jgi:AraC-like DNA-binding protein